MKKIRSIAVMLILTVILAQLPLLSTSADTYGDYSYKILSDGTAEITGYSGSDTCLTIPNEINGYTVTSIGYSAFFEHSNITSITIPDSVTSIGDSAFYFCTNLTNIAIPNSVTSIGGCAFYNCKSINNIDIPDGITSISYQTFFNCENLTDIIIPDHVKAIEFMAFCDCTNLTSITIPDSVTSIGSEAFINTAYYNNNNNWDKKGVLYINKHLIKAKPDVVSGNYDVKEGTVIIADEAFTGCTSLMNVKLPNTITDIGESAFSGCTNLMNFNIPNSVNNIDIMAFDGCTNITSITIPDSITKIGYQTFQNCTSLSNISIPNSVTNIGENAFYNTAYFNDKENWENNQALYIGNYLIKANSYSFLENFTIKGETKVIAENAFYFCTNLTAIDIPDSVTYIGSMAFYGCTSLANITLRDSITSIGEGAFFNTAYYNDNTHWDANGVLYIDNHLISIEFDVLPDNYTIKDGIKTIAAQAFYDCTDLNTITIPDSVTSIGEDAFFGCNNLHTVVFTGSKKDWDNLFIDVGNDSLYNANITFAPRGDVNGDEKIDASDLLIIQNMMLGYNEPSKKADINGDGFITADDLLMVQFIILGF